MSKKLCFYEIHKKRYSETEDIIEAIKALNKIVEPNILNPEDKYIQCTKDDIEWAILALNDYFKSNHVKKWKRFQIGCIANLLVKEGCSINKTKKFLSEWLKCSDTYVRDAYYEIKEKYNSTYGFLLIDKEQITSFIEENLDTIPNGYEGWVEALKKQLELHSIPVRHIEREWDC